MATFAEYILGESNFIRKVEIVHFLKKKQNIFFNNTVIMKAEIAREFIDIMKLDVDKNMVITACLMYSCLRIDTADEAERAKKSIEEDRKFLKELGFSDKFAKICTEYNRTYSKTNDNREKESDILEIIDQFGGMLFNRQDRLAYSVEEAMHILKKKNLKNSGNQYLNLFEEFVDVMEDIKV
ncbi:MAG: hypothetical protein HFJ43_06410 [Clostridia bacterium]|nr:hypothetical protein [Clostridia bacterium]